MALLEIKSICRSFHHRGSELVVLKDINNYIEKGELVALTGPSGAGKSTLMHIMGGLDKPTSGEIIFNDNNIYNMDEESLNKYRGIHMGFIFQFHYLLEDFTALENVMIPMLLSGKNEKDALIRAKELVELVGLKERLNHFPAELSGGEQQRIAVARAIANNPDIILADEPTGNLDKANSLLVLDILKEHSKKGASIVIVTHDEYIASECTRKIELQKI